MMRIDRVFGIVLVALFSSLLLLAGSLYINVNDQIRNDEATLKVGTFLQRQTVYVFDRGAVYGYRLAQTQIFPQIADLIHQAIKHHDAMKTHKSHRRIK